MQRENQDLLVDVDIEIPGFDAAHGWIGDAGEIKANDPPNSKKSTKDAKETREPEAADDAIEVIKRERDEALSRLAKSESESQTALQGRDAQLTEAREGAAKNEKYAVHAHYDKVNSDLQQLDTALRSTQIVIDAQKREWLAAEEVGDKTRAINAQEAIAEAKAEMVALGQGKAAAEQEVNKAKRLLENVYKDPPKSEPEKAEKKEDLPKQITPEDYITKVRSGVGTKVADWLDEHREFITDAKLNNKFLKFAEAFQAVEEKPLNGKDFIKALNDRFAPEPEEEDNEEDTDVEVEEPKPKAKPMAAAPVSRNSSPARNGNGMSGGKVRLNSDEQTIAANMYPDMDRASALKKYAANKARAIADGKYQR